MTPRAPTTREAEAIALHLRTHYGIGLANAIVRERSYHHEGRVYRVSAATGVFYLKLQSRTPGCERRLETEARLLDHCAGRGVAVATTIPTVSGTSFAKLEGDGGSLAVLYRGLEGTPMPYSRPKPRQGHHAGAVAGALHNALDTFHLPDGFLEWDLDRIVRRQIDRILPQMRHAHSLGGRLRSLTETGATRLESLLPREPPEYGCIHGDLGFQNFLFSRTEIGVIDFERFGAGFRVGELAGTLFPELTSALESRSPPAADTRLVDAFLSGYGYARPIGDHEVAALPLFAALLSLRHLAEKLRWGWRPEDGNGLEPEVERRCRIIETALDRINTRGTA